MKNFKKVISAVIALAMSISTFASASSFTDVADTHANAEAIEVLAAMGIVTGYDENGTFVFKPEGTITRAEAATMIVGALNMTEDAKAAAGTSQFADVNTQAAWAAGYVNVGVAQGFISGMDATTFAPQENVTYAQMCVMLTSIAGYGKYAAANSTGTWYSGYTNMAAATGINKGVSVAYDTALTRGQVAQMIYNTLKTPMLGIKSYSIVGNEYEELDGTDGKFKTLLSEKFDGYVVTATVTETPKSADLENGYVNLSITKAAWWDGAVVKTTPVAVPNVAVGKTDAVDMLHQSGTAIIIENENDEYELVFFSANTKTETKELDAADYVANTKLREDYRYETNGKVRFGSTYYRVAAGAIQVYVNGVLVADEVEGDVVDNDFMDTYLGNAYGTVRLVKTADDTAYSKIFVDVYEVAEVVSVNYKAETTTVNLAGADIRKIVIDDEDLELEEVELSVKKNGAEIELKNLVKGDIVAIAYNPTVVGTELNAAAKFIKILATDDTVTGRVSGKSTDDETVKVDTQTYKLVDWDGDSDAITVKDTFTFTLDPFGRIYDYEVEASSKNFAIVEKLSADEEKVTLVLPNGTSKTYEFEVAVDDITDIIGSPKAPVAERIVEFTVKNSNGKISAITPVDLGDADDEAEFKKNSSKLGSFAVTSATQIIYAGDYEGKASDYAGWTIDNLVDGTKYVAYAANRTSNFYGFVLIMEAGSEITEASRFAVVKTLPEVDLTPVDEDDCYSITALYNGDETTLYFETEPALSYGDAFYFLLDSDGMVEDYYVIYDHSETAFAGVEALEDGEGNALYDSEIWSTESECFAKTVADVQLVYGIVTDVKSSGVTFGVIADGKIDNDISDAVDGDEGTFYYGFDSEAVAYEYDTASAELKESKKINLTKAASTVASNLSLFEVKDSDNNYFAAEVDGEYLVGYANYAVAMVVDGLVVAIYSIIK